MTGVPGKCLLKAAGAHTHSSTHAYLANHLHKLCFPELSDSPTQDAYNKLPLSFTDRYSALRGKEEKNYTHTPGLEIGNDMPGKFQCFRDVAQCGIGPPSCLWRKGTH